MRVTLSDDGRDFLRRDWSDLVDSDPAATFFHTPRYLKLYWEEFGHDLDELLLAFAEEDGRTVGAAAFERLGPTLRFLGGPQVTDYKAPVAAPGPVEGGVVQVGPVPECERDGAGHPDPSRLQECQPEHPLREERLGQPPEEDLHPRDHELPLGTLAGAVHGHERAQVVRQGLRRGQGEGVAPELTVQASGLPPDLVAELAGEAGQVLVVGRRQLQARGHAVLSDLDRQARPLRGVVQPAQPG